MNRQDGERTKNNSFGYVRIENIHQIHFLLISIYNIQYIYIITEMQYKVLFTGKCLASHQ